MTMTARTFAPHPDPTPLATPFGTMYAVPTSADHVSFSSTSSLGDMIVINGVKLSVHVHLYRDPDGNWTHLTPADPGKTYRPSSIYARRVNNYSEPSEAQTRKIVSSLIPALVVWIDGNQHILADAERGRLNNVVMDAETEVQKARKLLSLAEDNVFLARALESAYLNRSR